MRNGNRLGSALLVGAMLALGACGGNRDDAANGTAATAGGDVAATDSMPRDSAAMAAVPASGMAPNAGSDVAGLNAADMLGVIGSANAGEVATSKVAVEKATNGEVKSFARMMITDHQAMQQQADQAAKTASLTAGTPPQASDMTLQGNQMAQTLGGLPKGAAFDRQYVDGQVQAHTQTLNMLKAMQGSAQAPVKALVDAAIPKVQAHLERAHKLQATLGGATGMMDSTAHKGTGH